MTYPNQQQGGYTGPGAPPPPAGGGGIKFSEHVGDLVWVKVLRYDPNFIGNFGAKPAVVLDVEVLTGRSEVGERFTNGLYSNVILVDQLKDAVGTEVFGRVAAKPGRNANPAIYLDSPWPGDEQAVSAFLARMGAAQQGNGAAQAAAGAPAGVPAGNQQHQGQPQQGQAYGQPSSVPPVNPQQYDKPPF